MVGTFEKIVAYGRDFREKLVKTGKISRIPDHFSFLDPPIIFKMLRKTSKSVAYGRVQMRGKWTNATEMVGRQIEMLRKS